MAYERLSARRLRALRLYPDGQFISTNDGSPSAEDGVRQFHWKAFGDHITTKVFVWRNQRLLPNGDEGWFPNSERTTLRLPMQAAIRGCNMRLQVSQS